jgi:hypothetical protein
MKGIGATPRRAAALGLSVIAATAGVASAAAAKKPAEERTHGKEIVQLECEGLGTLSVSVAPSENNNGVGQIVGERGHGIPVSFTTTVTDVTKGTLLFTESHQVGNGNAHPHQPTTPCKGTFEATAADFFEEEGEELPEGVEADDLIRGVFEVQVIIKK